MHYLIGGIIGFLVCTVIVCVVYFVLKAKVSQENIREFKSREEDRHREAVEHYREIQLIWRRIADAVESIDRNRSQRIKTQHMP